MAKRINSKSKGSNSERKIANLFTEFFGEKFSRTPGSGAFGSTRTINVEVDMMLAGDFITPKNFVFCMENKCGYPEIDLLKLFESGSNVCKTRIAEFLTQCTKDSDRVGLKPMVIYTQNRKEPIVIVQDSFNNPGIDTYLHFEAIGKEWNIYSLERFLNYWDRTFFFKPESEEK